MYLSTQRLTAGLVAGLGMWLCSAHAETRVCRGIVTANWTVGVADGTPHDTTRLIIPFTIGEPIGDSCLFDITTEAGKKIMSVCQMGMPCKATVVLLNEPADVYLVGRVLSVVNLSPGVR